MFNYTKSLMIAIPVMYSLMIVISITLGYLLRNKKTNIKRIPILVITIILFILEIIKQIYLVVTKSWTTWALPFHFCSSFYVWFAIASFSRKENIQQIGYATSIVASLVLFILFLVNPTSIISNATDNIFKDYSNFHTVIFHFLTMLMWLLIVALKLFKKPTNKTILFSTLLFLCFYVLSTIFAFSLNTNYICILYNGISFLENIRIKCGQFLYDLVMYLIGIILPLAVLYLSKLIFLFIESRKH